jgi:hypothetical protein
MQTLSAIILLTICTTLTFANRSDYISDLIYPDIPLWGVNNTEIWCPDEHYVYAFSQDLQGVDGKTFYKLRIGCKWEEQNNFQSIFFRPINSTVGFADINASEVNVRFTAADSESALDYASKETGEEHLYNGFHANSRGK